MKCSVPPFLIKGLLIVVVSMLLSCGNKLLHTSNPVNKVTLARNDTVFTFQLWSKSKLPTADLKNRYYYYIRNSIESAQGSYVGKPLDGTFVAVNAANKLMERGMFKSGMKEGKWITWYENGNIRSVTSWHDGVRSGKFWLYSDSGKLRQEGQYKNDLLTGRITSYDASGIKTVIVYNEGIARGKNDDNKSQRRTERKQKEKDQPKEKKSPEKSNKKRKSAESAASDKEKEKSKKTSKENPKRNTRENRKSKQSEKDTGKKSSDNKKSTESKKDKSDSKKE